MVAETSELRSGITAPFNKRINEALQFNPQMGFNIENTVTPSQLIGVLKGEQGTPGLPAAISVVKDDNNLIMLAVSPIERGLLKSQGLTTTLSIAGGETKDIDIIVPAGKKWIIKNIWSFSQSLVATVTFQGVYIVDKNLNSALLISGTSADLALNMPTEILIPEDWTLRYRVTTTAWTSGQRKCNILVQELTI